MTFLFGNFLLMVHFLLDQYGKRSDKSSTQTLGNHCWSKVFAPSTSIFLWKLFHEVLSVDDIMRPREFEIICICHCCNRAEEFIEHLFFNCPLVTQVWRYFETHFHIRIQSALIC